jgi:type III secretion system FlhB-like substrate exporter
MSYNITKNKAPKMPALGKGTECIKILLSQASKDMHEPLVPMLFPVLGAHISVQKNQHSLFN